MTTKFKTNTAYYPYAASKCGRVQNLETGVIQKPCVTKNGYAVINTRRFGTLAVHRVVMEIWEPLSDNSDKQVNHIDCDKTNNNLTNLEWCTRSENMIHAAENGLLSLNCNYGEDCNLTLYSDEIIEKVCQDLERGDRNIDVARRYSISSAYIKDLKAGKQRKDITGKYTFKVAKKRSVSEDTVRWICSQLRLDVGITEIVKLATNQFVTIALVKNIKYGKCYADISRNYL